MYNDIHIIKAVLDPNLNFIAFHFKPILYVVISSNKTKMTTYQYQWMKIKPVSIIYAFKLIFSCNYIEMLNFTMYWQPTTAYQAATQKLKAQLEP